MRKTLISIFVSAIFLYLALRKIDWEESIAALKGANYIWLLPSLALCMIALLIRAIRWQILLLPTKKIRISSLFSFTIIGFMGNFLLPARAGELIRVYILSKKEQLSKSTSFATVILERILDGISIFLIAVGIILIFPELPKEIKLASFISCILFFSLFLILAIFRNKENELKAKLKKIFKKKTQERIENLLSTFFSGLAVLENKTCFFFAILYSFILWLCVIFSFYLLFFAFPELMSLPIIAAGVVMVTISLGVALPQAPGFVGTYQYFCIIALGLFGISHNIALSYSFVAHLLGFIPVVVLGLIFLTKEGLSLSKVKDIK